MVVAGERAVHCTTKERCATGERPATRGPQPAGSTDAPTVVHVSGRFDTHTAAGIRELLHAAVQQGDGLLLIDMSTVDTFDATGLGVLVGTHRLAEQAGRQLALRGTPARLTRLLHLTRLDRFLPTVPVPPAAGPAMGAWHPGDGPHITAA
jgi:anti-anti-sigma factor